MCILILIGRFRSEYMGDLLIQTLIFLSPAGFSLT